MEKRSLEIPGRWTEERIHSWYARQDWLIGCNYIPSTAINQLEMWQAETYDPATIRRELAWASRIGFNTIRVFLHDLLWYYDARGLMERMDDFLSIASGCGIRVMFVIFDGVWDPHPENGVREPVPFLHNSGWLQSPGANILSDPEKHYALEDYVKGILRAFADDRRVAIWDLFNEPDNLNATSYLLKEPINKAEASMRLLERTFIWARDVDPSQPLTAGLWYGDWSHPETMKAMDRFMVMNSDLISFHNYDDPAEMEKRIQYLGRFNRPLVCTEYMARTFNNTFQNILPIFRKYNVGGYNWGFVDGKTQTSCPWDSWIMPYEREPPVWFHDIFHTDGTPYRSEEVDFIMTMTGVNKVSVL